jgi:hypothetical protein
MANFNLADYETVEDRIKRFTTLYEDGRITTVDYTSENDRAAGMWRVKAFVYLSSLDQEADLPKATGHAFEVDGVGMANKTSALENAETSAIGRALANMALSGNKRASREEMAKAERGVTPSKAVQPPADFEDTLKAVSTVDELNVLWVAANGAGYASAVQTKFAARKKELTA